MDGSSTAVHGWSTADARTVDGSSMAVQGWKTTERGKVMRAQYFFQTKTITFHPKSIE